MIRSLSLPFLKGAGMNHCVNCNKETKNPKFCSRSCAAIYNNKHAPTVINNRRKKTKKCRVCSGLIYSFQTFCKGCRDSAYLITHPDTTLADVIYRKHHKSSAFSLVRRRARTIAKHQGWKACSKCGYDKHIEICHIKSISSFPETALVSEVNALDNLLPLCPNCHWEHDNLK